MPPIFANDYSSLQANMQSDQARREAAMINSLQMMIGAQREQERRRELRDAIAMQQQQQAMANQMAQRTFDEQVRQFDIGNQTNQDELAYRRQALMQRGDVVPASVQADNNRVEIELARTGQYRGNNPNLISLNAQAIDANNKLASRAGGMANVENTRQRLGREMEQSEKTVKDIPWWRKAWSAMIPLYQDPGYTYEEQRQNKLRDRIRTLPTFQREDIQDYTEVDPRSGYRTPMYRPMTNAMPQGPIIDVPSTVQTNTATIQNPYTPGKRYGNLRYLGGDPNLETSWQPVQ